MAAYTTIDNPELFFQAKLFTGTGSSHAITFDGDEDMQPDLVWIKVRSGTGDHGLWDVVRGTTQRLVPNGTTQEGAVSGVTAFGSNGFTVGAAYNVGSDTYVAWCFTAGGSASSNSDGSVTTSVSANSTSGVSLTAHTGTGSGSATIGHGLGAKPKIYFSKPRNLGDPWIFWFDPSNSGTSTGRLTLNATDAQSTAGNSMVTFNATTITLPSLSNDAWSGSYNYMSYMFVEKQGFSKFGSFLGNGSDNGPFVFCGFKPAFVLTKKATESSEWHIYDNKRDTINPNSNVLSPNADYADSINANCDTDFLSNGFKLRNSNDNRNDSGETHIFMAFAESPFVNSNGVPNNGE